MTCAQHPISPEQWLAYVEGTGAAVDFMELDNHLSQCGACRDIHNNLSLSRGHLLSASRTQTSAASLSRIWDGVRFRIRRSLGEPKPNDLRQLRSILISMCGEAAAEGALESAHTRNLGTIVEVMCGTRAARFVEHAAQTARRDMVA